jgi:hypothetical protein
MEESTSDTQKSRKKWLIGILIIPWIILISLYYLGFCFDKMKFFSKEENIVRVDMIVMYLAEHGMAKKKFVNSQNVTAYNYDEADMKRIFQNVDHFLKKHPEYVQINRNYSLNPSEVYNSSVSYLLTPEEVRQVNMNQINPQSEFNRKIIGISYWQSYSACGHPTFGAQDYIYESTADLQPINNFNNKRETK